jgi:hypothetical protein
MNDPSNYQALIRDFAKLLRGLSASWTEDELAFVQDLIDHNEPAEAMSNFLAISQTKKTKQLTASQAGLVKALCRALDVPLSPSWFCDL